MADGGSRDEGDVFKMYVVEQYHLDTAECVDCISRPKFSSKSSVET